MKIYNNEDIYSIFVDARSSYFDKKCKAPKNFEKFFNERLSKSSQDNITILKDFLNTKWGRIDPYQYFLVGFNIYKKKFAPKYFLEYKILDQYKHDDKNQKRGISFSKEMFKSSFDFIEDQNIVKYANTFHEDSFIRKPFKDYIDNNISLSFLVWVVVNTFLEPTDEERGLCPFFNENHIKMVGELEKNNKFIKSLLESWKWVN